jgi:hypothetical protein
LLVRNPSGPREGHRYDENAANHEGSETPRRATATGLSTPDRPEEEEVQKDVYGGENGLPLA